MPPKFLVLLLLVLCTSAALPAALAQQAPAAKPATPMYGTARIWLAGPDYCYLSLADGVTPTPTYEYLQQDGKKRRFADEAAALNFLYQLGWEVQPLGIEASNSHHCFLLKRRTP